MALDAGRHGTVEHGGSVERARALFPDAPEPWIDLSTGISPHAYSLFDLPATAFARLPEPGSVERLCRLAAGTYRAPSPAHVVAAPGTQILLARIAALVPPGRACVLVPTYAEHARAAALAGHRVMETGDFGALAGADLAVVVNPNNPDGRIVPRAALLDLAASLRARGGLLVVDEAFMDVGPEAESLAGDVGAGDIVVLRSFGKFHGLAGLRLGFALSSPALAAKLEAELGPWAVSGPAIEIGSAALADAGWREAMRLRLEKDAARLDALLAGAGLEVVGGTSLFRFLRVGGAPSLFRALGKRGILIRRFARDPAALRIGLPGAESGWQRLEAALDLWHRGERRKKP